MKPTEPLTALKTRNPGEWRETYSGRQLLLRETTMAGWARFGQALAANLPEHVHAGSYEICYFVSGSVEWWVGSQIYQLAPRDVFVTLPGEHHGGLDAVMHPCELYWVQVRPSNAICAELARLRQRNFKGGPLLVAQFERLLAEHRAVASGDEAGRADAVVAARAALHLLVVDTMRFHDMAVRTAERPAPSPPIAAAMAHLFNHFDDPACLARAAAIAGLQGTQFRKRFQAETGFAPHDYLVRSQVQEARRRLVETDRAITAIALDLGFATSQYFATVFRKLVGSTPQEYRRRHRG